MGAAGWAVMTRSTTSLAALGSEPAKTPKGSKYGNARVEHDGHKFASRKERDRYVELKLMQRQGLISDLVLQPRFPLTVAGFKVCTYVADFQYLDVWADVTVVEDVKGYKTDVYRLKAKLFHAIKGFPVREV